MKKTVTTLLLVLSVLICRAEEFTLELASASIDNPDNVTRVTANRHWHLSLGEGATSAIINEKCLDIFAATVIEIKGSDNAVLTGLRFEFRDDNRLHSSWFGGPGRYDDARASWSGVTNSLVIRVPDDLYRDYGTDRVSIKSITFIYDVIAPPKFSPPAGRYTGPQSVVMSTTTDDASIHYTLDGSEPTTASPAMTGALTIASTTTIKAVTIKAGLRSSTESATYIIDAEIPAPKFNPPSGTVEGPAQITITAVDGAEIRYTTDGSEPSGLSTLYYAPIPLTSTERVTIKAVALINGTPGRVATATYNVVMKPQPPRFNLPAGVYPKETPPTLHITTDEGTMVRYTNDGSEPTLGSMAYYEGGIPILRSQTIKARAFVRNTDPVIASDITEAVYIIGSAPEMPHCSPAPGTYDDAVTVALSASAGHTIRYTLDGSKPGIASSYYAGPITISTTTTLKAIAISEYDRMESEVLTAVYNIRSQVATPQLSHPGGNYANPFELTITGPSGAAIRYTLDGSTPSTFSTQYTGPITIATSTTVKAIAVKDGRTSDVITASYVIDNRLEMPRFDPPAGSYASSVAVSIKAQDGATIHFTDDGSIPTTASPTFYAPITLTSTRTIKAIAVSGGRTSDVAQARYVITQRPEMPRFDPPGGEYNSPQSVTITASQGDMIRYTLDGSEPSASSPLYYAPIAVNTNVVLKAIALRDGLASETAQAVYMINDANGAPQFNPPGGTYDEPVNVVITAASGSIIRYTLDDTTPDASSALYTAPLPLATNTTIKAVAIKNGKMSDVAQATYVFNHGQEAATIADFIVTGLSAPDDPVVMGAPLTVTCSIDDDIYATDGVDHIHLSAQSLAQRGYRTADIIPAGWSGRFAMVDQSPCIIPVTATMKPAMASGNVDVPLLTPLQVSMMHINRPVDIDELTFTQATPPRDAEHVTATRFEATGGGITLTLITRYPVTSITAGTYKVRGIVDRINNELVVYPLNYTHASGIDAIEQSDISITAIEGGVAVRGVKGLVSAFDMSGRLIVSVIVENEAVIALPKGMAVIHTPGRTAKVIVR